MDKNLSKKWVREPSPDLPGGFFSHGPHGDSPPCDRKSRPSRVFRIPLDNF